MVLEQAKKVLRIEAEGILGLENRLDGNFTTLVEWIASLSGRVIVAGIGKSGLIGRKIVATLNSTGTRSLFLHPVEAMHGDLGMVTGEDLLLALSNSGETDELNMLVPAVRNLGCRVAALTSNPESTLAKHADLVVNVGVEREACPLGLAPTASTTALLALGDALAVVLIEKKRFGQRDFKRFHPGGALGQRLAAAVEGIMLTGDQVPSVSPKTPLVKAIEEIDRLNLGATLVVGEDLALLGIITDGDLRRFLLNSPGAGGALAETVMTANPKSVTPDTRVAHALNLMEKHLITVLPVVEENGRVMGILHLHDILGKGSVRFNGAGAL
ncbi:MAG: KpsF/GutQ family sugar-phosphate isomerase [Deltaproteobacteria bacterium]|nr:KpsF/GutQ family sugar-phosphate isomerase [Deltaproteobacteria bacterium]